MRMDGWMDMFVVGWTWAGWVWAGYGMLDWTVSQLESIVITIIIFGKEIKKHQ